MPSAVPPGHEMAGQRPWPRKRSVWHDRGTRSGIGVGMAAACRDRVVLVPQPGTHGAAALSSSGWSPPRMTETRDDGEVTAPWARPGSFSAGRPWTHQRSWWCTVRARGCRARALRRLAPTPAAAAVAAGEAGVRIRRAPARPSSPSPRAPEPPRCILAFIATPRGRCADPQRGVVSTPSCTRSLGWVMTTAPSVSPSVIWVAVPLR